MKGVGRGSAYNSGITYYFRSGIRGRWTDQYSEGGHIGFRSEWCIKGWVC